MIHLVCGCKISKFPMSADRPINFCPLHKAAPRLLEACKTMQKYIARSWDDAPDDEPAFLFDARMTIAEAERRAKP